MLNQLKIAVVGKATWLLLLLLGTALPALAEPIKLGLILTVDDHGTKGKRLDTEMLNATVQAFNSTRRFILAEREQLEAVLAEQSLDDMITGKTSELNKLLDLDLLGTVNYSIKFEKDSSGKPYETYWIEVQLTDLESGRVIMHLNSDRTTVAEVLTDPTSPAMAGRRLFENIREAFPPEGVVVQISGEKVLVDLGTDMGIGPGDDLQIIRSGEGLIHPVTGVVLPGEDMVVASLKVVSANAQIATCKLKKREGTPQVADLVRYQAKQQQAGKFLSWMSNFKSKSVNSIKNKKKEH